MCVLFIFTEYGGECFCPLATFATPAANRKWTATNLSSAFQVRAQGEESAEEANEDRKLLLSFPGAMTSGQSARDDWEAA